MVPDGASLNCLGGPVLSCVMCTVMNRHRIEQNGHGHRAGTVSSGTEKSVEDTVAFVSFGWLCLTKSEEGKVGCRVSFGEK